LRVAWLNHRDASHPRGGGAERSISEIGRRLRSRGHDVTLVTANFPGGTPRQYVDGVDVRRYGRDLGPHLAAYRVIRELDPDVVIGDLAHILPWGAPILTKVPCVLFFHHLHARTLPGQVSPPLAVVLKWIERQYRFSYPRNQWITESKSSAVDLTQLGIRAERIHRIPPGIDSDFFRPVPKSDKPSLVYFGGFRRYKHPEVVVEIVRRLVRDGFAITVDMVGAGPEYERVRELARKDARVESSIRFLGRIPYSDLPQVVGRAWVNIHCAVAEGWCISAMEAAAAGTPTVGYRVPGLTESVSDGSSGILVEVGNIDQLVSATRRALLSMATLAEGGRQLALTHSWDATAQGWERVLEGATRES